MKAFEFPETAIVRMHEDYVVVDKPVGIPCQSRDEELHEDLPYRLQAFLEGRGDQSYLGSHQRLDQETSGILLYTRKKELNRVVAEAFEKRTAKKRYLAAVTGWREGSTRTLEHYFREDRDGLMRKVASGKPNELARSTVRLLEKNGNRALLEVDLHTGRTHQIRAQLASLGCSIVGDPWYGGEAAERLMLHSWTLEVPQVGKFESKRPRAFARWLAKGVLGESVYDDASELTELLSFAAHRRYGIYGTSDPANPRRTDAFRWVHHEADGLPKLAIDLYAEYAVVQYYEDGNTFSRERRTRIEETIHAFGAKGVYRKVRPKQANVLVDTRRDEVSPPEAVLGESAGAPLTVYEEGVPFLVRLGDGLSTGIFLDQRANRKKLRGIAGGKSVLNLFSYTCAFSVAAAEGSASASTNVDVSQSMLAWGKEMLSTRAGEHSFFANDVFAFLGHAKKKNQEFDIVILDPPSYSTSKDSRLSVASDLAHLVAEAAAVVHPHGWLFVSTNHRKLTVDAFRAKVFAGLREANRTFESARDGALAFDFPPLAGSPHLKSVWVKMGKSLAEKPKGNPKFRAPERKVARRVR